ncbi:MAG TPA: hypothetical protein VG603_09005 [Chitinophagales bacterium]|nr:hypothetical protein [Chitinophagales bacterium]
MHNRKISVLIIFIAPVLLFYSCKKEEAISTTPVIKFVSIAPNPAVKYQDTVKIVIAYTDGDGDLGENSPDVKNLFVTDSRNNVTSQFRISQLAPSGSNIIIEGNLDIILSPQGFVDDNDATETATYSIYVVDRAGNKSNTVQTSPLVINQ